MNSIQLDKPVSNKNEDHFQRYGFSKRIATIINAGNYPKSLVIGIYGKWGEGKSSVLNFIENEIDESAHKIKFNPWYFQEDKLLIKSFFESVASELGKKLNTKKEDILNAFVDYGDSLGSVADLGLPFVSPVLKAGKNIAVKFKNDSLEHYKKRIEGLIEEAKANFVIFIDDIDRLNIDEIQSVFKLIKLVGDFPRFSYVLAFDDELVAASLGHEYGGRARKDGYDFLEKIVQLPLPLPKASPYALKKFCLDQIQKTLNDLKIQLLSSVSNSFMGKFESALVPGLKNPRMAVRFANAVSFAIPLLLGEVNLGDLMIVEGIKVFYPELYYFIRANPDIFLTLYSAPNPIEPLAKDKATKAIDGQLKIYGENLATNIKIMLCSLFPQLDELYNNYHFGNAIIEGWVRNMNICSSFYFQRFFSYAVNDGEISDVYFRQLFTEVDKLNPEDFVVRITKDMKKLDLGMFIFKVRNLVNSFTIPEVQNLFVVLSMLGKQFPLQEMFQFSIPKIEMAKIIRALITRLDRKHRVDDCLKSLEVSSPMNYTLTLYQIFIDKKIVLPEELFLSPDESTILSDLIITKFQADAQIMDVFNKYLEEDLDAIFEIYNLRKRKGEITSELIKRLNDTRESGFALKILRIFAPTIYSSATNHPFKTYFTRADYESLKNFIDPVIVYNKVISIYGKVEYTPERQFYPGDESTDQDLIITFEKVHNEFMSMQ
jgi:hypothetical protein